MSRLDTSLPSDPRAGHPAPQGGPARGRRGRRRRRFGLAAHLFVLPATVLVFVFLIWPFFRTVSLSFTNADGSGRAEFVGFDNYSRFFNDPVLSTSLRNTLIWVAASLVLPVVIGFFVALGTFGIAGGVLYRYPFILPYVVSGAAVGAVWSFILRSDGVANDVLTALGLGALAHSWLLETPTNTFAMIVASTWQGVSLNVILFLVGLQAMPREPIEAARVDGARGWTMLRHIVIPLIRPMTIVVVGTTLVNSLKTFDIIWLITEGGPFRSSETLAVTMFREAFLLFRHGYGAAISVLLTVFVLIVAGTYLRRQLKAV